MLVIIMGVSGCGKTTLGTFFAKKYGWRLIDADDYHSEDNKIKMSKGIALNDADRLPWLLALHQVIKSWQDKGASGVLCCSALKESYREILINGKTNCGSKNKQNSTLVVYLKGTKEIIQERLRNRDDHFMPMTLLDSQLATLEEPQSLYHNTLYLSVENSVETNATSIYKYLQNMQ